MHLPPEALADLIASSSKWRVRIHMKQMGEGTPVMILLHGFGASTFSWREVMAPLAGDRDGDRFRPSGLRTHRAPDARHRTGLVTTPTPMTLNPG